MGRGKRSSTRAAPARTDPRSADLPSPRGRRHGKLVSKSLGTENGDVPEEWRRPEEKAKAGREEEKEMPKEKGRKERARLEQARKRRRGFLARTRRGWNKNRNWWEANKEKPDGKDNKGGEKDAKKADK